MFLLFSTRRTRHALSLAFVDRHILNIRLLFGNITTRYKVIRLSEQQRIRRYVHLLLFVYDDESSADRRQCVLVSSRTRTCLLYESGTCYILPIAV